jgi:hypothetical protein
MAKLYHVDIARHAAKADHKWVDNLLSHFDVPGVQSSHQGSPRRISVDGIQHIALIRLLSIELNLSVAASVSLATRLLASPSSELVFESGLKLSLDSERFRQGVHFLIADGVESVTPAPRGRPRKS